jgi:hypothetical protein
MSIAQRQAAKRSVKPTPSTAKKDQMLKHLPKATTRSALGKPGNKAKR